MDKLVFQADFAFGFNGTLNAERLTVLGHEFASTGGYVLVMAAFFVLMALALLLLRRGVLGRLLIAMRDSPAACGTLGLDMRWFRVALFGLSAGMAGLAGGAVRRPARHHRRRRLPALQQPAAAAARRRLRRHLGDRCGARRRRPDAAAGAAELAARARRPGVRGARLRRGRARPRPERPGQPALRPRPPARPPLRRPGPRPPCPLLPLPRTAAPRTTRLAVPPRPRTGRARHASLKEVPPMSLARG